MSVQLIQQYHAKVEQLTRYGGSRNESTLRKPFQDLLEHYARAKNLVLVPEVEYTTQAGRKVYPDGTLKDALRQDWGYWESKDEKDDLEAEIAAKFARGYPNFNILFEDTHTAILYQGGAEVARADFANAPALDALLTRWASYEPEPVREFHKAIELFSAEVDGLAKTLREVIEEQAARNAEFKTALAEFLELCRQSINPKIELADVREMMIQHVLTEDIFMRVFDEAEFHRDNVIAHKLAEVAGTFYKGAAKRNLHAKIAPYYEAINARAAQISDHHEKQKFLKALYEKFYRAYNPKAADRLGIVYTPDEIVRFMIESADHLTFKHFGRTLGAHGVEILDPATGTGTFITELIEYLPPAQLHYKYAHEIHCNEVSILPYYIANLNIEYTYKQKTGQYAEFENICFVDTLDNLGFERANEPQMNFLGMVDENVARIGRQNTRRISVVIGNPPYNAWQENFNNQNANRAYPGIDKRIKETYIKHGTAQNQIAVYDMYVRFVRWASDRVDKNGIIAFVSNNSFLNARSLDGFRKVVSSEFNEIYIVDLKGDAHTSGERRQEEGGNIFSNSIKVGVAVYFLLRKQGQKGCKIYYNAIHDYATSEEKKSYLRDNRLKDLSFQPIRPDKKNNWLNQTENDFDELTPVVFRASQVTSRNLSLFSLVSNGVKTQRDEWVYDFSEKSLEKRMKFFVETYQATLADKSFSGRMKIKWDRELTRYSERGIKKRFNSNQITQALYRPFVKMNLYFDEHFNGMTYQIPAIFPNKNLENVIIAFSGPNSPKPFTVLATDLVPDLNFLSPAADGCRCLPLYRYTAEGERLENITDWALEKFKKKYEGGKRKDEGKSPKGKSSIAQSPNPPITKSAIFHYVYAVLHHPAYRAKYAQNLKREFPRIPFYKDFWQWAGWGKQLMELHVGYEAVKPYPLQREDKKPDKGLKPLVPLAPTCRLIARKETGVIEIDTQTTLRGVPPEAWEYRLGTYTAIEWVLERYKEKKPKDPTIAEKFNTYRFSDYKEQVIELLGKVCAVSVETMAIIKQMPE